MKYLVLIAIIPLLASAVMTEQEGMTKIQNMESTQFGRTLLATIALQLQTQDSADDLILMLRSTEQKMFGEQQKEDAAAMELQNQCYADINRLNAEIQAAQKRIKEIDRELNEKIPIRDGKIAERTDLEGFRDLLVDRLRKMVVQLNIREQAWVVQKKEHDAAAAIIQNAKQVLDVVFKQSFLQKIDHTQVFAQMNNQFAQAKKMKFTRKSWSSIFQALATMTSKVPVQASGIQGVYALMDRLLDEIAKSREVERRAYEQWIQEYERTRQGIQNRLDETNAAIAQLTTEIDALTKRINMLNDEKADLLERIRQKTEELNQRTIFCDDEAAAYSQRRQAHQKEIEVVSDAIALLTSQLRTLKKYTSEKTSTIVRPTI